MSRSQSTTSIDSHDQFKYSPRVTTPKKTVIVNKNIENPLVELKCIVLLYNYINIVSH